jgi:hypothetical protein
MVRLVPCSPNGQGSGGFAVTADLQRPIRCAIVGAETNTHELPFDIARVASDSTDEEKGIPDDVRGHPTEWDCWLPCTCVCVCRHHELFDAAV